MLMYGDCYKNGTGVDQDVKTAFKWYKKAASRKNEIAFQRLELFLEEENAHCLNEHVHEVQCIIGDCHIKSEELQKAFEWYSKAANSGYARGQYLLAKCYSKGKGTPINKEEAIKWYSKAAEQGYSWAQEALATCYENGEGVEQDLAKAEEWRKSSNRSTPSITPTTGDSPPLSKLPYNHSELGGNYDDDPDRV